MTMKAAFAESCHGYNISLHVKNGPSIAKIACEELRFKLFPLSGSLVRHNSNYLASLDGCDP